MKQFREWGILVKNSGGGYTITDIGKLMELGNK